MTMLQGHLALHDVTDIEKLAARALTDALRTMRASLDPHEHDDLLAYLIQTAWRISGLTNDTRSCRLGWTATFTIPIRACDTTTHQTIIVASPQVTAGPYNTKHEAQAAARHANNQPTYTRAKPPATYDPRRGWSFSKYAYNILTRRVIDWYRDRYWDTRHAKPEHPISLDGAITQWATGESTRERSHQLERALGIHETDRGGYIPADLGGLIRKGHRRRARRHNERAKPDARQRGT